MNAIGIDYQRTGTVAWVREETRAMPVGDGTRFRVPTVTGPGGAWGSAAAAAAGAVASVDPADPGPWPTPAAAPVFWAGLRERLFRFLGRTAPTHRDGYPAVVTGEGLTDPARAARVAGLAEAAGFEDATAVPAPVALLARWLPDAAVGERRRVVVAVAVGDGAAEVGGFRVESDRRGLPRVEAAGPVAVVGGVGGGWFLDRVLGLVAGRMREPLPAADRPVLADAVLEYAAALGRPADPLGAVWTGPFRGRMYAPLVVTAADARGWPEAVRTAAELPAAVAAAARSAGGPADMVLVGGPGAAWPFAAAAAAGTAAAVWVGPDPSADLALGAAWVPVFEARLGVLPAGRPAAPAGHVPVPPPPGPPPAPGPAADRPPWERRAV